MKSSFALRTHRYAFTLVELLVVITIIGVLASLTFAGLSLLKTRQMGLQVSRDLDSLTLAITQYLNDYGVLGESSDSQDFIDKPLVYLTSRPTILETENYFDPDLRRTQYIDLSGVSTFASDLTQANVFLDPYMQPYQWKITNTVVRGLRATTDVWIYSTTGDDLQNAQGRRLSVPREWTDLRGAEAIP